MSNYKARSDYFKSLAGNSRLIAHGQPIAEGSEKLRRSFYRVNDLDELNAACREWAHFPCMVHVGHDIKYKQTGTGLPRKIIGNHLFFLSKAKAQNLADEMENAYDVTETAMNKVLGYMNEEMECNHRCGNLFLFDLKGANAEQVGPFNDGLFGWHLTFYDETRSCELGYDSEDWIIPIEDGINTGCSSDDDGGGDDGGIAGSDAEIINFEDESIVEIEMTSERKAILGKMPLVQVWILDNGEYALANVPVTADAAPPDVGLITAYLTGPSSGFITLKRSVA